MAKRVENGGEKGRRSAGSWVRFSSVSSERLLFELLVDISDSVVEDNFPDFFSLSEDFGGSFELFFGVVVLGFGENASEIDHSVFGGDFHQ